MSEDKWIFVNDKLPTNFNDVLVLISEKTGYSIEISYYLPRKNEWAYMYDERVVLYWQPLPELPEELRCKE